MIRYVGLLLLGPFWLLGFLAALPFIAFLRGFYFVWKQAIK